MKFTEYLKILFSLEKDILTFIWIEEKKISEEGHEKALK